MEERSLDVPTQRHRIRSQGGDAGFTSRRATLRPSRGRDLNQSDRIESLFLVSLSGFSRWGKCGDGTVRRRSQSLACHAIDLMHGR
jgi:hypothetical protein